MPWPAIGAGAASAIIVLLLAWLFTAGTTDPTAALTARLGTIETQLRELAGRPLPQPAPADSKAVDELAARLARIEAAVAAPRAPVTDTAALSRLAATDDAVRALTASVAQLARRVDTVAATMTDLQNAARAAGADRGELAALSNKIAALEQSNQALRDELAKRVVASASDRAVRLAMLATALRGAVERGGPFAAELAAAKPVAGDGTALTALEPFAASGLLSDAALGRELAALIEPIRLAVGTPPRDSNFIDRLQANAQKLVRIRPVGEVPGDEPSAILARIEIKAGQADIDGALTELAKLPEHARAPAQAWIAKVQARNAALAAANRFASDALAALKTTP